LFNQSVLYQIGEDLVPKERCDPPAPHETQQFASRERAAFMLEELEDRAPCVLGSFVLGHRRDVAPQLTMYSPTPSAFVSISAIKVFTMLLADR
jgi:hypothetical protein